MDKAAVKYFLRAGVKTAAAISLVVLCAVNLYPQISYDYEPTDTVSKTRELFGEFSSTDSPTRTVNINTAELDELMTLDGIGEKRAQAIIDYRTEHGSFREIDDLQNVYGIGEATIEKNREIITL